MCKACHGQQFEGTAGAPRLAGKDYDYLIGSMNAFADGGRTNNLDMPGFMKALTQTQRIQPKYWLVRTRGYNGGDPATSPRTERTSATAR